MSGAIKRACVRGVASLLLIAALTGSVVPASAQEHLSARARMQNHAGAQARGEAEAQAPPHAPPRPSTPAEARQDMPQEARATFSTRTDAVRLDVLVTRGDRPVSGLTAADFEVWDGDTRQSVRLLSQGEASVDVILVLDVSESMAGDPIEQLVKAVRLLLDELRPNDRLAVVTFSHVLRLPIPLSADTSAIRDLLQRVTAGGRTSLNDAALAGLLSGDPGVRTMMIVFTDGLDRSSWLPPQAAVEAARRLDVVVYGVTLRPPNTVPVHDLRSAEAVVVPRTVVDLLAAQTAGRVRATSDARRLTSVFRQIFTEFRQRYVLAFEPAADVAPGWHPLRVRVPAQRADVSARAGYFVAPPR